MYPKRDSLLQKGLIKQGVATEADYNPYKPAFGFLNNQLMFTMKSVLRSFVVSI